MTCYPVARDHCHNSMRQRTLACSMWATGKGGLQLCAARAWVSGIAESALAAAPGRHLQPSALGPKSVSTREAHPPPLRDSRSVMRCFKQGPSKQRWRYRVGAAISSDAPATPGHDNLCFASSDAILFRRAEPMLRSSVSDVSRKYPKLREAPFVQSN